MRRALFAAVALLLCAFSSPGPTVAIAGGNIILSENGESWTLTSDGAALEAAVAPNGQSVAYTRREAGPLIEGEDAPTSLRIVERATRQSRLLLASTPDDEVTRNLRTFGNPTFSLDGGYVYILSQAWVTSGAVHQVNVRTGAHRFVVDANDLAVIRNGRYAGYLLVNRHMYHGAPDYGAYDPWYVVRPDGKESFMVPGSDTDDDAMQRWLTRNLYQAW